MVWIIVCVSYNYKKIKKLAEREGFEPSIEFPLYTLSKRAPSATRPSLRGVLARQVLRGKRDWLRRGSIVTGRQ